MDLIKFNSIYEEQSKNIFTSNLRLRNFLKAVSNNYKYDYKMNVMVSKYLPYANSCADEKFWKKIDCTISNKQRGIPYLDKNNEVSYLFDKTQVKDNLTGNTPKFKLFEFSYPRDYKYINNYINSNNSNTQISQEDFEKNILNYSNILYEKFELNNSSFKDFYVNTISQIIAYKLNINANFINEDTFIDINENNLENDFIKLVENTKKELINIVNYVRDENKKEKTNQLNIDRFLSEDKKAGQENKNNNAVISSDIKEQNINFSEKNFTVKQEQLQIVLNVGYEHISIPEDELPKDISLKPLNKKIDNKLAFIGKSFEDSKKIDLLMDSGKYEVKRIKTHKEVEENIQLLPTQNVPAPAVEEVNISSISNMIEKNIFYKEDSTRYKILNIQEISKDIYNIDLKNLDDHIVKNTSLVFVTKDEILENFKLLDDETPAIVIEENPINNIYAKKSELDRFLENKKDIKETSKPNVVKEIDINNIEIKKSVDISNFRIVDEIVPIKLKPSERLNNNIDAISMIKRLESGQRELDINAQEVLSKYVGWGGLSEVFDKNKTGQWEVARNFLKENLTEEEYMRARESTLTAFYTPKVVIDNIYNALENLGFKGGNILEPSCATGNFIGNIPDNLKDSKFYGVELDHISGKIAKYLYPNSNIQIKGFEETKFSNNLFDIVVGNVPFGEFKINDRAYNKNNFLVHDYFFAKSIDKVRTGGIIAFITSSGTLDKKDDSIRRYIGSRCDLLGAIRLPNDTFKGVAGTEVTSDIIFLQKKNSIIDIEQDWYKLDTDVNGLTYNKYFVDNPNMIIGDIKEVSGRFGNVLACVSNNITNLSTELNKTIKNIKGIYQEVEIDDLEKDSKLITLPATDDIKNFSFSIIDDKIFYRENSLLYEKQFNDKDSNRIKDYIRLTESLKDVISSQVNDFSEQEIIEKRDILNKVYDKFSKDYGYLNSRTNDKLLSEDSNYPLVSSIEVLEKDKFKEKGDIFFKRTIKKPVIVDRVDTAEKSLILSVSQKGKIDFDYMQSLTDMNKDKLINDLRGRIFVDIKNMNDDFLYPYYKNSIEYVPQDEYLSGNIRKKISVIDEHLEYIKNNFTDENISKDIIEKDIELLEFQKSKLLEVLPKDLSASEINVRLGTTWIPKEYYEQFMYETFNTPSWQKKNITIDFSSITGEYYISNKKMDALNTLANTKYGTDRMNGYSILESSLNLREVKVFDRVVEDGKVTSVLNREETTLSNQKQDLLKEDFKDWIYKDYHRRTELEKIYNEKFNSVVNRNYDGSNLTFDGLNTDITLNPHQKNAVARALYGGNSLFAHVVGAGKTYEMVASIMESKKLGFSNKALMVVPNHLTRQIGREFMDLYPTANILVANKKDFETKNRKRFIGKIATGEYDAIIIGHTQFERIPMSKEYQVNHIRKEINDIVKAIKDYKNEKNLSFTVKQLESTKKKLETRLEKLLDDTNKDDVVNFEELGIDKLVVDEAHNYKNLYLYTKMQNVAGIGQTEALKTSDMFMKCRYMDEKTNSKGIIFATGTPVSNTMSEMYTLQRYLSYNELKKSGLHHFDSWATTFGETVSAIELSPEGTGYRLKTRFSKFYNLPELITMFKEFADVKTADMLNLPTPNCKYETIVTKPTELQKELLESLSKRAEDVRNKKVDSTEDNMLKITNDGKKLALDQRIINENFEDSPNSKVNVCIDNVFKLYQETTPQKSTQLIFCDMSTPDKNKFNIYDDIKEKLIQKGVPENEIAYIHDANNEKQKEELFEKVRNGEIRIFLGSTQKCGAGTNIQNKLAYLHDLDVPWRPSDLEQRAGRIVRQGNDNKEVKIFRYVTENTFDSYLWQTIENKQKFISQIMTSKSPARVAEDLDENVLSYAEIKSLATGNPLIKEKMDLDVQVSKLKMLEKNFKSNLFDLENKIQKIYPDEIKSLELKINKINQDLIQLEPLGTDENKFTSLQIGNDIYTDKREAGEMLLKSITTIGNNSRERIIGRYRGFNIATEYSFFDNTFKLRLFNNHSYYGTFGKDAIGNITRMDNLLDRINETLNTFENKLNDIKLNLETAKEQVSIPFSKAEELKEKQLRLAEVNRLLSDSSNNNETPNKSLSDEDIQKDINNKTILNNNPSINFDLFQNTNSNGVEQIII